MTSDLARGPFFQIRDAEPGSTGWLLARRLPARFPLRMCSRTEGQQQRKRQTRADPAGKEPPHGRATARRLKDLDAT